MRKSLEVTDFNLKHKILVKDFKQFLRYKYIDSCKSEYFTIAKYVINYDVNMSSNINLFSIINCVQ